jgi:hypothetical protein
MTQILKGDCMPTINIEDINKDDLRGKWVECDEEQLTEMFVSVIITNDEQLGSEYAFHRVRDAEFFANKFPGFSDKVYEILATEQAKLDSEKLVVEEVELEPEDAFLQRYNSNRVGAPLPIEESLSEIKNRHY